MPAVEVSFFKVSCLIISFSLSIDVHAIDDMDYVETKYPGYLSV